MKRDSVNCTVWIVRSAVTCLGLYGFLLLPNSVEGQDKIKPLVSAEWLSKNIGNPDVVVIDLAHRVKDFRKGHIPGAIFVDWRKEIIGAEKPDRYTLPTKEDWQALMSRCGIEPETHLVFTDNMDNRSAVRMYWTSKYFGHQKISVLNGGTNAWQQTGLKVESSESTRQKTNYKVTDTDESVITSMKAVQSALESSESTLIDGRPEKQYSGELPGKVFNTGKEHQRRGHIRSAINIPWKANIQEDGRFMELDKLRSLYKKGGVEDGDAVITYCNEGLHAAMPWFVLHELLGHKEITLYDDSMAEWANRDDTPMSRSDEN